MENKELKHLKLGKMTSQEIAKWIGIKYSTYSNNIEKYLIQLDNFCDFEKIYGGVIIKEIYQSVYEKNIEEKYDKMYLESTINKGGI